MDCGTTTMHSSGMQLVGRLMYGGILTAGWLAWVTPCRLRVDVKRGAVAFAMARATLDAPNITQPDAFVVRRELKQHGRCRQLKGIEKPKGVRSVIVDHVATTEESMMKAIEVVRSLRMIGMGACCVVDRGIGVRELLGKNGVDFDTCSLWSSFAKGVLIMKLSDRIAPTQLPTTLNDLQEGD